MMLNQWRIYNVKLWAECSEVNFNRSCDCSDILFIFKTILLRVFTRTLPSVAATFTACLLLTLWIAQVTDLLDRLYTSFDEIAERLDVFKANARNFFIKASHLDEQT